MKKAAAERRQAFTAMIEAPAGESQSNGEMEKACHQREGQLRTLKFALETSIGEKISVKSKDVGWLNMWTATSLNHFHVGFDGNTAFAGTIGNLCNGRIAEFREQARWKKSVERHARQTIPVGESSFVFGLMERTGDVCVADSEFYFKRCRTMTSRPANQRWSKERVLDVRDNVPNIASACWEDCSPGESEGDDESND